MMRVLAVFLQLTLWAASAHAFTLFVPEFQCGPTGECGGPKRQAGSVGERSDVLTLDLVARPRDADHASATYDPIERAIGNVARKYGRYGVSRAIMDAELGRRENTYAVSKPLTPTTSNSAGVYQWGPDYSYFIQVKVGSAQQPFYMLLDTGAGNTWLMDKKCTEEACTLHNRFDPSTSSSFKSENKHFFVEYGTGNLTGIIGDDKISFAGKTFDFEFGLANHTADDFKFFAFDGILGLAMSDSVTGTFLQIQKQKKSLDKMIFGLSINRDADGINDGQVTFGGVDPAKYTGEISYLDVPSAQKSRGEWVIPLGGISYNGKKAKLTAKYGVIDTGTSFIFASPGDADALHENVPGSQVEVHTYYKDYFVPCDITTPMIFTFGGKQYEIPAKDWLGKVSDDKCKSRIYGMNGYEDTWIMGDVFLKYVYTVFDADNGTMRIGFAAKAPPPKTATTTAGGASSTSADPSKPIMPGFGGGQETSGTADPATTAAADVRPTQEAGAGRLGSMGYVSSLGIAAIMMAVA